MGASPYAFYPFSVESNLMRWRWAVWCLTLSAGRAGATAPALRVDLSCPQRDEPGRVVCELGVQAVAKSDSIVWVDALVVQSPAFVRPLRSRVTTELRAQGESSARISIAFVATELGQAQITLRARAVLCSRGGTTRRLCTTATQKVAGNIVVGASR